MEKKPLIVVIGPTASGKSEYAVRLAHEVGGEIISGDSMQIYRGMDIGTAKPTADEMGGIPHHLIDIADISTPYSVSDFVVHAGEAVNKVLARGRIPIVAGGTGLYIDTLIRGIALSGAEADEALRRELFAYAEEQGNEALHKRLAEVGPESAAAIHPNNVKRVVRAIEIFTVTGKTKSELDRESLVESEYDARVIMLLPKSREKMYSRIDKRVDAMLERGLRDEVLLLCEKGLRSTPTASAAIGYKEFYPYFDGECGMGTVRDNICLNTRHYAKRQLTWFSGMKKDEIIEV